MKDLGQDIGSKVNRMRPEKIPPTFTTCGISQIKYIHLDSLRDERAHPLLTQIPFIIPTGSSPGVSFELVYFRRAPGSCIVGKDGRINRTLLLGVKRAFISRHHDFLSIGGHIARQLPGLELLIILEGDCKGMPQSVNIRKIIGDVRDQPCR